MIWTRENIRAVAIIKAYLNKLKANEERNTLIATEIVEELYNQGLYFNED